MVNPIDSVSSHFLLLSVLANIFHFFSCKPNVTYANPCEFHYLQHLLTTRPTKTPDQPKGGTESSNPDSRYKSVAIAMSVLLAFFVLLAIVVGFITYRRRSPRSWVTASPHDDITAKPFYNSDEHL